ncbi:hypothetical protein [Labrenzia sp. VG12]|uniref:hypothetical protein n=1 Tax=Labrenzia sp. VG12 TaxID=2021862 RepID=UPI000B8C03A3|nr:hypothetical protein [Labrenzia sp. VG12]ASP36317.1 hypothetical protein CHH27_26255 [Labrenzia sp. VG12]
MTENLDLAHEINTFRDETRQLSISARFALAMCFLNELGHRLQLSGDALDDFRTHMWASPVLPANSKDFDIWYNALPPLASGQLTTGDLCGITSSTTISATDISRFVQAVNLSSDLLQMSFFLAADNEGTYEALRRISDICRPERYPSVTPFKFSTFDKGNGWGAIMSRYDHQFWKRYSETWFKSL